jgi:hypothetical protein
MQMVVTLKSGAQVRGDVKKFSTETAGGMLSNIKWTTVDQPDVTLTWVSLGEVAAVHAERIQEG